MENKNIDLAIEDLKLEIIETINKAKMPPSIIYYIVKDIYEELSSSYQLFLKQERARVASQTSSDQSSIEQTDNSAGQS